MKFCKKLLLKIEILDIRKQLLLNLQHKKTNEQLDSMTNLKRSLERDMYGMAMKEAKKVSCSSVTEKEIETIIQQMIVKCDGIGEFTFCHHSNRLYRAVEIDEKSLIDTTEMNTDEVPAHFECPIYFDKDAPVLLIRAGAPVLESVASTVAARTHASPHGNDVREQTLG